MIKIYIANLGKYNEGHLVGEWITLPTTQEDLQALYTRIGINAQYEEIAIHDYETEIEGLKINEYSSISKLNEMAEELENVDIEMLNLITESLGTYDIQQCMEILDNGDYTVLDDIQNMKTLGIGYIDEIFGGVGNLDNDTKQQYIDMEDLGIYLTTSVEWFANEYHELCETMSNEEIGEYFMDNFGMEDLSDRELCIVFDYEAYAKSYLFDFTIIGNQAICINA